MADSISARRAKLLLIVATRSFPLRRRVKRSCSRVVSLESKSSSRDAADSNVSTSAISTVPRVNANSLRVSLADASATSRECASLMARRAATSLARNRDPSANVAVNSSSSVAAWLRSAACLSMAAKDFPSTTRASSASISPSSRSTMTCCSLRDRPSASSRSAEGVVTLTG